MTDEPKFFSREQLSKRYGVSVETIRYWDRIKNGPVPVKLGRHVRYPIKNVLDWEAARSSQVDPHE